MKTQDIPALHVEPIASIRLSTEQADPQDQFDLWREITSSLSDVEQPDGAGPGYRASMDLRDLGGLQLVSFKQDAIVFRHTRDHVRRSGVDHWMLAVVKKGGLVSGAAGGEFSAPAGSVLLKSFAIPFSGEMERTEYSGLYFSRDDFGSVADLLDKASHQIVGGPMGRILGDFVLSVERHGSTLAQSDLPALNETFANLLKAAIMGNGDMLDDAHPTIAATRFERARDFINENLTTPRLKPDLISAYLGISRRQLSYLFEPHGGVASYIRNRRLAACHQALMKTGERKYISAVAYQHGFTNLASFYRQFQAKYGVRPGEARSAWPGGRRSEDKKPRTFAEWMSRVEHG